jgi:O-antigen/teichoic acid export membrane protein
LSTLKRFFKDSIIYGIAAVLPRVINFLLVRVHTDALPADVYAENTDFYIWAALFSIVLTLGFETTFFRYFKDEKYKDSLVGTSMISLIVWVGLFLLVFSLLFSSIQSQLGFGAHPMRLKMFMGIMALDTFAIIPFAYLRATGRPMRYTFIKLVNVAIIVIIQLFALRWIPNWEANGVQFSAWISNNYEKISTVDYIFISNLIGSAVSLGLVIPYLLNFKWKFNPELLRKMLVYSYPIVIAGLAYAINENLDKWLIGELIDKNTEGLYAAAYKLAIFMNLYIMAFRLGAEPFFFHVSHQQNAQEMYAQIMKYFVIVGSIVLVGVVLFIDIFKHLINPNYWSALEIVPIVLLANLFLGIYHNLSIWYKLIDKTRYGMYFSIVGAFLTIFLNLIFLKEFGYMVAAWATLAAYGAMMLLSYYFGNKKYPIPYEMKKILIYLTIAIFISFIAFYQYKPHWLVSGMIVVLYTGMIVLIELKQLRKFRISN